MIRRSVPWASNDEGWFHSGDICSRDKDGQLLFHGRLKSSLDVYSTDGELISHFGFDVPALDETIGIGPPGAASACFPLPCT